MVRSACAFAGFPSDVRQNRPALIAGIGFGLLALLIVVVAGQPLVTDDTWLHLALGRAYAQASGPWLAADPLLANAPAAPIPTAWLFDLGAHGVLAGAGFTGLRVVHVALVAAILWLAWTSLRRASGSALAASLGGALFIALAAYRLVQLRPHLLSMLAVLLLYRLVLAPDARPTRARIAAVAGLFALWANVHAAFLLGPMLLGAGALAALIAYAIGNAPKRAALRPRLRFIVLCGVLGSFATLLNPAGVEPHLAWFVAGRDTPALERVADEWTPVDPFSLPVAGLPPSALALATWWVLALGCAVVVLVALRNGRGRDQGTADDSEIDPVLVSLAIVGLVLPLVAVRFLWLGVFPILLLAHVARGRLAALPTRSPSIAWALAAASCLAAPAFVAVGDWPMITNALPTNWSAYRAPYQAAKYHADLIWILQDAGLRGTAFTDYHLAGFAGFQLAPDVRTLVNGTLNVSPEVIAANRPLRARSGERAGESFAELLDRHAVDLFIGIRLPRVPVSAQPWFYTTGHLERTPGWIPIFRNLTGAIYLRTDERNRDNLDRITAWYAGQQLPFDAAVGFDPEQIVRADRGWAMQHGVVPLDFDAVTRTAFGPDPTLRNGARDRLASIYTALGLYERAIDLDAPRVQTDPDAVAARRRLVWCLLRLHRVDEAMAAADGLAARPAADRLSHRIAEAVREVAQLDDEEQRAVAIAQLPVFTARESSALTRNVVRPGPRLPGS
jgi:hypothetical protein